MPQAVKKTGRTTPKKTSEEKMAEQRKAAAAALEESSSLTFEIAGNRYTVHVDEVSASMTREFRAATGMSVAKAMELLGTEPDVDVWQCLCFLARRQAGEDITLDDVDDFNYADMLTLEYVSEEETDSPEA